MDDFASVLLEARKRSGLTQAQLADSAGLTPSYLSFIENRKKPPPSDDVCRRLAAVLGIPDRELLEVAHIERAPEALQKKVKNLTHTLKRERRSRLRALKSLLSPFLFAGPPGFRESALEAISISATRKRRIREVLAAVGRDRQDLEKEVSKIVDELPDRERNVLLEQLPGILSRSQARHEVPPAPSTSSAPTSAPDKDAAAGREPPLLYDPPAELTGVYRLAVPAAVGASFEGLDEGDEIVVDPAQRPGLDDLVVVRREAGFGLRRLVAHGDDFALLDSDAASAAGGEPITAQALAAWIAQAGAGTVIELRRPLRRRRPPPTP